MKALIAKRQKRINNEDRQKTMRIGHKRNNFMNLSDDEDAELPSPRTSSGKADQQFLPFYGVIAKKKHKIIRKKTMHQSLSNRIRPFMLLSHLSPIESPNNYYYVEQMNTIRVKDSSKY